MSMGFPNLEAQDSSKIILATVVIVLLLTNGFAALASETQSSSPTSIKPSDSTALTEYRDLDAAQESFTLPVLPEHMNYDINIVFLGIDETRISEDSLVGALPQWYAPISTLHYALLDQLIYDMNFSLSYDISYLGLSHVQGYRSYLYENSREDCSPWFINLDHPRAYYAPSSLIEAYITENIISDPTPTLIIIDTYSFDPAGHHPYYYNASENEIDAEINGYTSISMPWQSTYQIAGGGKQSRLLWLDLSAGPTYYTGPPLGATPTVNSVTEENVPPIWTYEDRTNPQEALTQDLVKYIAKAVECKFLPSYYYLPLYGTSHQSISKFKEVKFEILTIDLDPTDYDLRTSLDCEYIVSEFKQVNPQIDWTYSLTEWDWESDSGFASILQDSTNSEAHTYDRERIVQYLLNRYTSLFNATTPEQLVIREFLFALPAGWDFDPSASGEITNSAGAHAFLIVRQEAASLNPEHAFRYMKLVATDCEIPQGKHIDLLEYLGLEGNIGDTHMNAELSVVVNQGTLKVFFLDEYNYQRYTQSLSFTEILNNTLDSLSTLSGNVSVSVPIRIHGQYHIVFEDNGTIAPSFDAAISAYVDRTLGFTHVTMHEAGHALGLRHPHDAFSWGNYDHPSSRMEWTWNEHWLWAFPYGLMSYAQDGCHHLSVFDVDTLQRGFIPQYWKEAVSTMDFVVASTGNRQEEYPEIYSFLMEAAEDLHQSITHYVNVSNPSNYYDSLQSIFGMLSELEIAVQMAQPIGLQSIRLVYSGILVVIVAIATGFLILRRRRSVGI
ncbi:MAG: hypothetical protein ACFFAX_13165 [Promethearchaeota archaeon]